MTSFSARKWLALGLLCAAAASCKKEKPIPAPPPDNQATVDNALAEAEYSSVLNEVYQVGVSEDGLMKTAIFTCDTATNTGTANNAGCYQCVKVTVTPCWKDTAVWPKNAVIDFGAGCTGCDGRLRKGKLLVTFDGPWKKENATAKAVTQDYYVHHPAHGGYLLHTGTAWLTNLTPGGIDTSSPANKPKLNIKVNGNGTAGTYATITFPDGSQSKWQSDRTYEMTQGHTTPSNRKDDVFTLYGTADGTDRKGRTYVVVVSQSTALRKANACKWIEDGVLEITPGQLEKRTVNFAHPATTGNGTCDSLATFTIGSGSPVVFEM